MKDLRQRSDIKQRELSEYLGIAQNTYSQYENGKIDLPVDILIKLADFYSVSVDYILGRTDVKQINIKNIKYRP